MQDIILKIKDRVLVNGWENYRLFSVQYASLCSDMTVMM